jgi:N-methylhydantoinase A
VPDAKLAGNLQLSAEKARNAIANLADQIGLSIEETAAGIIGIANEHMAKAIREISVNRGFDPQEFVLASFGGAGGLHVCALAEAMQMKFAMVPSRGGVLSALGMLVATRGRQFSRTVGLQQDQIEVSALEAEFQALENQATEELNDHSAQPPELNSKRSVDICYRGQSYTLNVPWAGLADTLMNFNAMHQRRYGYALSGAIEVVNICVDLQVVADALELPGAAMQKDCNNVANSEVYGEYRSNNDVTVIARDAMKPGRKLSGPAVITEYSATTFVAPDWRAETDPNGNLRLQKTV